MPSVESQQPPQTPQPDLLAGIVLERYKSPGQMLGHFVTTRLLPRHDAHVAHGVVPKLPDRDQFSEEAAYCEALEERLAAPETDPQRPSLYKDYMTLEGADEDAKTDTLWVVERTYATDTGESSLRVHDALRHTVLVDEPGHPDYVRRMRWLHETYTLVLGSDIVVVEYLDSRRWALQSVPGFAEALTAEQRAFAPISGQQADFQEVSDVVHGLATSRPVGTGIEALREVIDAPFYWPRTTVHSLSLGTFNLGA